MLREVEARLLAIRCDKQDLKDRARKALLKLAATPDVDRLGRAVAVVHLRLDDTLIKRGGAALDLTHVSEFLRQRYGRGIAAHGHGEGFRFAHSLASGGLPW